jgi:ABC-type ATPase involved in cell division
LILGEYTARWGVRPCPEGGKVLGPHETRKLFGIMFQDGALFGSLNLYENVAFPLREHTKKKEHEIQPGGEPSALVRMAGPHRVVQVPPA